MPQRRLENIFSSGNIMTSLTCENIHHMFMLLSPVIIPSVWSRAEPAIKNKHWATCFLLTAAVRLWSLDPVMWRCGLLLQEAFSRLRLSGEETIWGRGGEKAGASLLSLYHMFPVTSPVSLFHSSLDSECYLSRRGGRCLAPARLLLSIASDVES